MGPWKAKHVIQQTKGLTIIQVQWNSSALSALMRQSFALQKPENYVGNIPVRSVVLLDLIREW